MSLKPLAPDANLAITPAAQDAVPAPAADNASTLPDKGAVYRCRMSGTEDEQAFIAAHIREREQTGGSRRSDWQQSR